MNHRLYCTQDNPAHTVKVGPRLYTGPSDVPDVRLEVECPAWCVQDHAEDFQPGNPRCLLDDFHESEEILVVPPGVVRGDKVEPLAQLRASLMVHTTDGETHPDAASIHMRLDEYWDAYADMGVEEADDLIQQLQEYTARFKELRDHLAAVKERLHEA